MRICCLFVIKIIQNRAELCSAILALLTAVSLDLAQIHNYISLQRKSVTSLWKDFISLSCFFVALSTELMLMMLYFVLQAEEETATEAEPVGESG